MGSSDMYMESENYVQNVDASTCSDAKARTYLIQFLCSFYNSTLPPPNPVTYIKIIISNFIKAPIINSETKRSAAIPKFKAHKSVIAFKLPDECV